MSNPSADLEVTVKNESSRAIIEGKTAVPFQTLVSLVLQRKVLGLFKKWGDDPVIITSELLTNLASAPQDSQENRTNLVLVTLGVGVLGGVLLLALVQILLLTLQVTLGMQELVMIAGALLLLGLVASVLARAQKKDRGQKVADAMEKLAGMVSK